MDLQTLRSGYEAAVSVDEDRPNRATSTGSTEKQSIHRIFEELLVCEEAYVSLSFLRHRIFRRENLQVKYEALEKKIQNLQSVLDDEEEYDFFRAVRVWSDVRQALVKLYLQLQSATLLSQSTCLAMVEQVESLQYDDALHVLGSASHLLRHEVRCIQHILKAELGADAYNFKDASLNLFLADEHLSRWQGLMTDRGSGKERRSCETFDFAKSLILSLTRKLAVIFQGVIHERNLQSTSQLNRQVVENELGQTAFKLFASYHRHTGVSSISLIYLVNPSVPFSLDGYACSKSVNTEQVSGMQSYPAICNYPGTEAPLDHWPNIISILQQEFATEADGTLLRKRGGSNGAYYTGLLTQYFRRPSHASAANHQPFTFFDPKVNATYIIAGLVPHLALAVIHAGNFEERKNYNLTHSFVAKLTRQLGHADILDTLRS
ncbi:hypothetical protein DFS34DRAFT_46218 [Phlyctochytrium arcticum]|nr:hypothetical protein DFS34DRAFT_46218 [Phlyctochytrium arcticum]